MEVLNLDKCVDCQADCRKTDYLRYHPNSIRCARVYGGIKGAAALLMLKDIAALVAQSRAPITLYIRSPGGSLRSLAKFENILNSGNCPPIITVADGDVRSAAAYLVMMGHYAYIKPGARMAFHGARYKTIRELKAVKKEDALGMFLHLNAKDAATANKLAEAAIHRLAHRYLAYRHSIKQCAGDADGKFARIGDFIKFTKKRMLSENSVRLVDDATGYAGMTFALSALTWRGPQIRNRQAPRTSSSIKKLAALVSFKDYQLWGKNNRYEEHEILDLLSNYAHLGNATRPEILPLIKTLVATFGPCLLSTPSELHFAKLKQSASPEAERYLFTATKDELWGLWCFASSLCRELLAQENSVTATEAYWLGLVDEVLDTNLAWEPIAGEARKKQRA